MQELVERARERLAEARHSMEGLERSILPAFLPVAVVESTLKRVADPSRDPLRDIVEISPIRRQWTIWRAGRRGRF